MRAAVLREYRHPLELTELDEPVAGAGEAIVRVRASGACGTDLKLVDGAFDHVRLPLVPGHEIAGELVDDVGELRRGQRVACYLYDPCGECHWCRAGQQTLCPSSRRLGIERDGGFAEYVAAPIASLLPFDDRVSFELAAVAMDAVLSPWHALLIRAQVRPGETLVVVGGGGLGLNGVQVALAHGARVGVVEPAEEQCAAALQLGAEIAVAPGDEQTLREWAGHGGADVAYEAVGTRAGFDTAVACVRPGARVVSCGYRPGLEYGLDSARFVLDELTLLGSRAGNREDARAALAAVEVGAIVPLIGRRLALSQANEALEHLRAGDATGRVVLLQD